MPTPLPQQKTSSNHEAKKVGGTNPPKEPFLLYVPFRSVLPVCRALTKQTCFPSWDCTKYRG